MKFFQPGYSHPRGNRQLFARTSFRALALGIALCSLAVTAGLQLSQPVPASAAQSIPYRVNFQGRLTNSSGNIVADGLYNIQFKLYDAASAGTLLWSETRETTNRVQVTNGLFSVQLGSVTALSPTLFNNATARYFEITMATPATATCSTASCAVWESPMTPRQALAASTYAMNSDTLDGLDSSDFAAASGSGSYIQNQSASPQAANFNISGSGTIGVNLNVNGVMYGQASTLAGDVLHVGNDSKLTDVNIANTLAVIGIQDSTKGCIQLSNATGTDICGMNGRIGISTNNPSYKLDVQGGDINTSGTLAARSTSNSIFGDMSSGGIQIGDGTITKTTNRVFQLNSGMSASGDSQFDIRMLTPAAPTVTPTGTVGTTSYTYTITALDGAGGETVASTATTTTTGNAILDATNYNALSWPAVTGASSYSVYRTASAGTPATTGKIGTVTTTSLNDTGLAASGTSPTATTAYVAKLSANGASWLQGGNLGIGTSSPMEKLHVNGGNIRASGSLIIGSNALTLSQNGFAIQPSAHFGVASGVFSVGTTVDGSILGLFNTQNATQRGVMINAGVASPTGNLLEVNGYGGVGGNLLNLQAGGNVGLGTTNPQGVLDLGNSTGGRSIVWGGLSGTTHYASIGTSFSSADLNTLSGLKLSTTTDDLLYSYTGTYAPSGTRFDYSSGDISFFNEAAGAKTAGGSFNYLANTKLTVAGTGNVGIGTTAPGYKLDVNGMAKMNGLKVQNISPTTHSAIVLQAGTGAAGGYNRPYFDFLHEAGTSGIKLSMAGDTSNTFRIGSSDGVAADPTAVFMSVNGVNGSTLFRNSANTTSAFSVQNAASSSILHVDTTNGRVGVGTAAPGSRLHVAGAGANITLDADDAGVSAFNLQRAGATAALFGLASGAGVLAPGSVANDLIIRANNQNILFTTDGGTTTAMALASNGNVGIGTTAPGTKLQVAGNALFKNVTDSTTAFQIQNTVGTGLFVVDTTNMKVIIAGNLDVTGNLTVAGTVTAGKYARSCPTGYVPVPGNPRFGTSDFCVMKYAASNDGSGNAVSTGAVPYVSISQRDSGDKSRAAGGHLLTEPEWMTIAYDALWQPANWCDANGANCGSAPGSVSKYLAGGHSDSSPAAALAASSNDADACFGTVTAGVNTVCGSVAGTQKRTLTLSNGSVIWDMGGNVWQWTDAWIIGNEQPNDTIDAFAWHEFNGITKWKDLNYANPTNRGWNSSQGLGQIYSDGSSANATLYGFLRGGSFNVGGTYAGAFTLALGDVPTTTNTAFGFRVAR